MPRFKPYDYNQSSMVVVNFLDQLQPGTFEHAIHYLISDRLDLSIFYPHYQNDQGGRPAYDPAILLKIILFAYSKGITSSREIQWCCEHNIIFKALSCDSVPHFTTLAAFVSGYSKEIEALFEQVLLVCYQDGLLGNELFAIDGCKMSSNAAKEWSGTFKELEAKRAKIKKKIQTCLKEHKRLDKQEADQAERARRLKQTVDTLNKAFDKIDRFLKSASPRMGEGRRLREVKSNITDNDSAKMTTSKGTIQGYNGLATVDAKHQIIIDAKAFGHGQEHHTLQPILNSVKERYDRLGISKDIFKRKVVVTADTGFANEPNYEFLHRQNINAYIPDNAFRSRDERFAEQKIKHPKYKPKPENRNKKKCIPASEFQFNPTNLTCLCPAGQRLTLKEVRDNGYGSETAYFEARLKSCRDCPLKHECMGNPTAADHRHGHGRQVSFKLGKPKGTKDYTQWMQKRVDSELGKHFYSQRMSVVEPVFANIGTNKGLSQFSLRGKEKVQGQWNLYCMVHNVEKWVRYGKMAA